LISWNFLQSSNAQIKIWLSLLYRSAQEDSHKIYFIFF
jgi:hypothetical protein